MGFILIGIGAILCNMTGVQLLIGGTFKARAGFRMRRGGPGPSFMEPPATEQERILIGNAGIVFGGFGAALGAAMLGFMGVLGLQDWHLWGQKISLLGTSSSPYLEVLLLTVTCVTVTTAFVSTHLFGEQYAPAKALRHEKVRVNTDPRIIQSRGLGFTLISAGTLLCLIGAVPSIYLTVQVFFIAPPPYIEVVPIVVFLSGPIYGAGLDVRRRGRRHFVPIVTNYEKLEKDSFILYLRWFKEDVFLDRAYPRVGSPFLTHFMISGASEEERLADVLNSYGRIIAAGDPLEDLPRVGADRFYLPLKGWQSPVRTLVSKAKLVVLSLGVGEGTLWELVEAMSMLPPERLILLVPMDEEDYEAFRREAHDRLQARKKELQEKGRSWNPPTLPAYRKDPRVHPTLLEGYRAAGKKTSSDSYRETLTQGARSGLRFAWNRETRSAFKAVIYYPDSDGSSSWGQPVFSRLDSAFHESGASPLLRDPRYVALKHGLRPALRRAFAGLNRNL
jgi:hypothetical protein